MNYNKKSSFNIIFEYCRGLLLSAPTIFLVLACPISLLAQGTAEVSSYKQPVSNFNFDFTSTLIKFTVATIVCIVILVAFKKYALKSPFYGKESGNIKIFDYKMIAPGKYIYVVEIFEHIYILGLANDNITKISEIREKEIIDTIRLKTDSNIKGKLFSEYLQKFMPTEKNN
ncbi:MAG TPA: flagellar biosynthetic protein FliO [Candidatus Wallbacteria bacterium]|nr:flagellar biosynthetic protein FliO [Candidatus Wallbacteria bacterium]